MNIRVIFTLLNFKLLFFLNYTLLFFKVYTYNRIRVCLLKRYTDIHIYIQIYIYYNNIKANPDKQTLKTLI